MNWRRNPAEAHVITACAWCRGEIYEGDEVYRIGTYAEGDAGGFVHGGWGRICAEKYAMERVYDAAGIIGIGGVINEN